jgi:carbamoylphosphate synthase small subunit
MKKVLIVAAVAGLLSACGTTRVADSFSDRNDQILAQQTRSQQNAISQAPEWMTKLPKSNNAVYESGTAASGDFAMADMKAKAIAYAKICIAAGGTIRSQTKVFRQDTDTSSNENSEMAIRSMCKDVDITGVETVDMKHVADGNRIRSYVLVALPLGQANILKQTKINDADMADSKARNPKAFDELDRVTKQPDPVHQKGQEVSVVAPGGTTNTFNLMPVDNAEYKAKRAEAIQKPGAVVGQVSVQ